MKTNKQRMNEEKNEYRKAMVKHGRQILEQLLCCPRLKTLSQSSVFRTPSLLQKHTILKAKYLLNQDRV